MSEKSRTSIVTRRDFLRTMGLATLGLSVSARAPSRLEPASAENCGEYGDFLPPPVVNSITPRCSADEESTVFTVVSLPDTQRYAEEFPDLFFAQTKWIAANRSRENIQFVTHLGDMVDNSATPQEWIVAREAMTVLDDAGVPYGTCLGNHDLMQGEFGFELPLDMDEACATGSPESCPGRLYLEYFGPHLYRDEPWYGGSSPTGLSNYQIIEVHGYRFLFLHLAIDPWVGELSWAQSVLDGNRDALVHVATHRYLFDYRITDKFPRPFNLLAAGRFNSMTTALVQALYTENSMSSDRLFAEFIRPNPNIFMVQCGHVDAEYHQVSENSKGLPVHEILVDFQTTVPHGGDAWLRLLRFDLEDNKIRVQTYSPQLDRLRQNGEGFEGSLVEINKRLEDVRKELGNLVDWDEVARRIDYWSNTPEGRAELFDLLYGNGQRDSSFTLDVDFDAYLASTAG